MIHILQAIFLGIVEGLTEFLPISSTGHLLVAERLIGFKDAARTFTVVIQLGAIAAVAWYYRREIVKLPFKLWFKLAVATIPAGLLGLALDTSMERFDVPVVIAAALIVGGIILLWVESAHGAETTEAPEPDMQAITMKQAIGIGVAQTIALIPGVSRSGATIVGGLIAGLNRVTATTFSFFLALPILTLAGAYKLFKIRHDIGSIPGGSAALLVGTAAAFVSAWLVVGWLLRYVSRHNFRPFAYYRIAFGCLLLLLVGFGALSNSR